MHVAALQAPTYASRRSAYFKHARVSAARKVWAHRKSYVYAHGNCVVTIEVSVIVDYPAN